MIILTFSVDPKYATASVTATVAILLLVGAVMAGTTDSKSTTATVHVNEFVAVTLESGYPVAFGNVDPDVTTAASPDLVITVEDETNVAYDVEVITTKPDFCTDYPTCSGISPEYKFAVSAMEWSDSTGGSWTAYSDMTPGAVYSNQACPCGTSVDETIKNRLTVPSGTVSDDYTTGMTITVKKTGT